jgi:hypothetical protein
MSQLPLKLWWVPQVPMKAFEVELSSLAEGVKLLDVLADYDLFQYENRVKPDYSNMGGIVMLEDGEWVDWFDEATGEDDPKAYLALQAGAQS